ELLENVHGRGVDGRLVGLFSRPGFGLWRRLRSAEVDMAEYLGVGFLERFAARYDAQRPCHWERLRRVALPVVAGLVAKSARDRQRADGGVLRDRDPRADDDLALEDQRCFVE